MADTSKIKTEEGLDNVDEETSITIVKNEISNDLDFADNEEIKYGDRPSPKRKLSTSGSSEDDDSKLLKLEGSTVDKTDQTVGDDDFNSCNEDEDSCHSEESESSTDDPRVLDDILSIKKMELLQHPQVIAFLQEKLDQTKRKGK